MKFETLKKDNRKKWVIGIGIMVVIVATVMFVGTRAKYKNTQRIDLVDGVINWIPSDLNVIAIKLQNDSGEYTDTDAVPTSGYTLSDKSYCEENGTKDTSVSMEYKDGTVKIGVDTKGTKCYLYFDKEPTVSETILAGKIIDTSRSSGSFTGPLTTNTIGKIFKAKDDDGDTYFFAGEVDNNWLQFGGFYWRIIRINGDGTIRLIYSGAANGNVSEANKTGVTTQIYNTTYKFNTNSNDNAYVGYMYGLIGQSGSNGYANTHKNTNSSTIKVQVDSWYNTNLNKEGIKEYIDTNAGFCGDRKVASGHSSFTGGGKGSGSTVYAAAGRIFQANFTGAKSTATATFKCSQSNDLYTVSGASKGNKALTYPIGLISSDEVIYAGSFGEGYLTNYYLYTNQQYWTMSPGYTMDASMLDVTKNGHIGYGYVYLTFGIRPVINLRANTKLTGSGTTTDPFKVV